MPGGSARDKQPVVDAFKSSHLNSNQHNDLYRKNHILRRIRSTLKPHATCKSSDLFVNSACKVPLDSACTNRADTNKSEPPRNITLTLSFESEPTDGSVM